MRRASGCDLWGWGSYALVTVSKTFNEYGLPARLLKRTQRNIRPTRLCSSSAICIRCDNFIVKTVLASTCIYLDADFEVIPEEVGLTHAPSGVQLDGSQRQAESAFASWRCGKAPSLSLTSGLSLSTRSDVDLKEFLVQRGNSYTHNLLTHVKMRDLNILRTPSSPWFAQSCSSR